MKTRLTKKTYTELKNGLAEFKKKLQETCDAIDASTLSFHKCIAENPGQDVANQMYITLASLALLTGQIEFIKEAYAMTKNDLFKQCSIPVQEQIINVLEQAISKKEGAL